MRQEFAVVKQLWRYFAIRISMKNDMKVAENECIMRQNRAKKESTKKNSYRKCMIYSKTSMISIISMISMISMVSMISMFVI